MKKTKLLNTLIATSLLSAGISGVASAHSITGGTLNANPNSIDVFRTTCVSQTAATIAAQKLTGINPGPASGFLFAVSLTKGSEVDVTVGWTSLGNINSGPGANNPNNLLPATAGSIITAGTKDTLIGAPWTSETEEPVFNGLSAAAPFGPTGYLDAIDNNFQNYNNYATGNGEYVIVISHPGKTATNYDFIGHCVNEALGGTLDTTHTGQGVWFTDNNGNLVPIDLTSAGQNIYSSSDYDQVISGN